jgi:hypothetical protein
LSGNLAIEDFGNWTFISDEFSLPNSYQCTNLQLFNGSIYAVVNHELLILEDEQSKSLFKDPMFTFKYLSSGSSLMIAGLRCITGCPSKILYISSNNEVTETSSGCHFRPNYAIQDQDQIWYADEVVSMVHLVTNLDVTVCLYTTI